MGPLPIIPGDASEVGRDAAVESYQAHALGLKAVLHHLELTEICLSLPPRHWDQRWMPPCLASTKGSLKDLETQPNPKINKLKPGEGTFDSFILYLRG